MTRDDLKSLIKECLVEIVTEGAVSRPRLRESAPARPSAAQEPPRRKTIGGMSLDRPAMSLPPQSARRETAPVQAQSVVKKITSDPVLASIFADTAATTLQEQAQAERMRPGAASDPFAVASANREADEMFGDAAHNWAALAFGQADR